MKIENYKLKIKTNVLLKNYTTFKIGGLAKYFFEAKTKEELIEAIKWARLRPSYAKASAGRQGFGGQAKNNKLPFFVLGGGSNVLFSDKGFDGLVIKMKNEKLKMKNGNEKFKTINIEAGAKLKDLVNFAVKNNLTGFEWAIGIPGTIGGAVYGNAAAFGKSISDSIVSVQCLEAELPNIGKEKVFKKKDCQFGLKDSIFKKNNNLIILSVVLELKKGDKDKIKKQIKKYLDCRKKHPQEPSAGCVFKNVKCEMFSKKNWEKIKKFPEYKNFQKMGFISSSFLIDKAGLKGKRINGALVSPKHANFIVNTGNSEAKDVLKLIKLIKSKVKNEFGIILEQELIIKG